MILIVRLTLDITQKTKKTGVNGGPSTLFTFSTCFINLVNRLS